MPMGEIRIVEYQPQYATEVEDFINECMYVFSKRAYKKRKDVSNIREYYVEKGGNFWIALDERNRIVGTIALENRGNAGIMKRFYVAEDCQAKGIGRQLYEVFERFAREETEIATLYLACGRVLEKAHRFYLRSGWEQTEMLEVEMQVAPEDDFFRKKIR